MAEYELAVADQLHAQSIDQKLEQTAHSISEREADRLQIDTRTNQQSVSYSSLLLCAPWANHHRPKSPGSAVSGSVLVAHSEDTGPQALNNTGSRTPTNGIRSMERL